jgi:hypothetical protein
LKRATTFLVTLCVLSLAVVVFWNVNNIRELQKTIATQQVVVDKLNEEVGKTEDGKSLNRIDTYDLVSGVVIQSIKQGNNK